MKPFVLAVSVALLPSLALAQGTGPFGGLFGRTPHRTGLDYKVLDIRGSVGGLWNDFLSEQTSEQPEPPFGGAVANAAAAITYDRRSDRLDLRAGSTVDYRDAVTSQRTRGTTFDGGLVLNGRLTTRLSTDVTANYRRSPFYRFYPTFAWLDEGIVVPNPQFDVRTIGYHVAEARVGGSFRYSKSSTVTASVTRGETWFPTRPDSNVTLSNYDGLWSRRLNRSFILRVGYGHREIRHHTLTSGNLIEEEINAGVDFHRALTISPRTSLAFTTQTSMVRQPGRERRLRLNGEALLTRRFHRTWKLQIDGRRATEVLAGFIQPLLVDSVAVSMSGQLSNRLEMITMLRGSRGRFGYEGESGPFTMAGATTRINLALARHLGLYGQYGFYHHDTPVDALSFAALSEMSRQTVTAGITTWIPVYTRERKPIDSR